MNASAKSSVELAVGPRGESDLAAMEASTDSGGGVRLASATPPSLADLRAEWLEWRRGGIGGSDVAGVLGLSQWSSPYSIWFEKVYGSDDDGETLAMEFGRRAEPMIAPWFHEKTGLYVAGAQTRCVQPEHPHRRCTIDGRVYETPKHDEGEFLASVGAWNVSDALGSYEAKTTSATPKEWEEEGIPVPYQAQAQWTMAVNGTEHIWFAVLHLAFGRPDLRVYELHRDEGDIALITETVDAFWHDHVLTGEAPATDSHVATTYATKHLPASAGDSTELDFVVAAEVERWRALKALAKDAEAQIAEVENALRAKLGGATEGLFDGQLIVSHRPQKKRGIDTDAFRLSMPYTAAKFATESTYRVLRAHKPPKPKKGTKQ